MNNFQRFVKRRDEASFNPNLGNILPNAVKQNIDFSLPTAAMKTGAAALQGVGTLAGGMVAALSGIPVTIAAMQGAQKRFEKAQAYILGYLQNDPTMRKEMLDKVNGVLAFLEKNRDIGVVGGGNLPVVSTGGVHGFGSALWKGLSASFRNLYDTLMNRGNKSGAFMKFMGQFREMFESLGEMSKEVAYGKLRAFKQAAEAGDTFIDPDTMR